MSLIWTGGDDPLGPARGCVWAVILSICALVVGWAFGKAFMFALAAYHGWRP